MIEIYRVYRSRIYIYIYIEWLQIMFYNIIVKSIKIKNNFWSFIKYDIKIMN